MANQPQETGTGQIIADASTPHYEYLIAASIEIMYRVQFGDDPVASDDPEPTYDDTKLDPMIRDTIFQIDQPIHNEETIEMLRAAVVEKITPEAFNLSKEHLAARRLPDAQLVGATVRVSFINIIPTRSLLVQGQTSIVSIPGQA